MQCNTCLYRTLATTQTGLIIRDSELMERGKPSIKENRRPGVEALFHPDKETNWDGGGYWQYSCRIESSSGAG
eukprot:1141886-Pelagomonas_calceolata.AAC.1